MSLHISITIKEQKTSILYDGTFSIIKKYQNNKVINNKLDDENKNNGINKGNSLLSNTKLNERLLSLGYEEKDENYVNKSTNEILEIVLNKNIINLMKSDKKLISYHYGEKYLSLTENIDDYQSVFFIHYTDGRSDECVIGKCKNYYDEIDELLNIYEKIKDIL